MHQDERPGLFRNESKTHPVKILFGIHLNIAGKNGHYTYVHKGETQQHAIETTVYLQHIQPMLTGLSKFWGELQ